MFWILCYKFPCICEIIIIFLFTFQISFLGYETNHNKNFYIFISIVVIEAILLIACVYLSTFSGSFNILRLFFVVHSNTNYLIVLSTYNLFLYSVRLRFSRLNQTFSRLIIQQQKFSVTITTESSSSKQNTYDII